MRAPLSAITLVLATFAAFSVSAQTSPATGQSTDASISANRALGEVKVIDPAAKQLIIKTDAGAFVTVVLNDATSYMRVAPGEKDLTKATKIAFAEVGEGDRVFARGLVAN